MWRICVSIHGQSPRSVCGPSCIDVQSQELADHQDWDLSALSKWIAALWRLSARVTWLLDEVPLVSQNIQADCSIRVDVRMVDSGCKVEFWRLEGVIFVCTKLPELRYEQPELQKKHLS